MMFKNFLKATLKAIGRIEPDIPKITATHNRLLKPIFLSLCGDTEEITDVSWVQNETSCKGMCRWKSLFRTPFI